VKPRQILRLFGRSVPYSGRVAFHVDIPIRYQDDPVVLGLLGEMHWSSKDLSLYRSDAVLSAEVLTKVPSGWPRHRRNRSERTHFAEWGGAHVLRCLKLVCERTGARVHPHGSRGASYYSAHGYIEADALIRPRPPKTITARRRAERPGGASRSCPPPSTGAA
jgi:hypothetical protein